MTPTEIIKKVVNILVVVLREGKRDKVFTLHFTQSTHCSRRVKSNYIFSNNFSSIRRMLLDFFKPHWKIWKSGYDSKVYFKEGESIELPISIGVLDNQVLRAARLVFVLRKRKEKV